MKMLLSLLAAFAGGYYLGHTAKVEAVAAAATTAQMAAQMAAPTPVPAYHSPLEEKPQSIWNLNQHK